MGTWLGSAVGALAALFGGAAGPERPVAFGYKTAWIAVHGVPSARVAEALGLKGVEAAGWKQGLAAVSDREDRVFVSPPVDGWVLAVGQPLGPAAEHDAWSASLAQLSRKLGAPVLGFVSQRVVDYYAWARAEGGRIVRSYAYLGESGETLERVGDPTPAEKDLRHAFFDERSEAAKDPGYLDRKDLRWPGEEDVLDVAARWSVDPRTLDARPPSGPGSLGRR